MILIISLVCTCRIKDRLFRRQPAQLYLLHRRHRLHWLLRRLLCLRPTITATASAEGWAQSTRSTRSTQSTRLTQGTESTARVRRPSPMRSTRKRCRATSVIWWPRWRSSARSFRPCSRSRATVGLKFPALRFSRFVYKFEKFVLVELSLCISASWRESKEENRIESGNRIQIFIGGVVSRCIINRILIHSSFTRSRFPST